MVHIVFMISFIWWCVRATVEPNRLETWYNITDISTLCLYFHKLFQVVDFVFDIFLMISTSQSFLFEFLLQLNLYFYWYFSHWRAQFENSFGIHYVVPRVYASAMIWNGNFWADLVLYRLMLILDLLNVSVLIYQGIFSRFRRKKHFNWNH